MSVSEIQIVAAESTAEVKSAKRYSICCCDVKRKERSKNDAIETVKPVEINTKRTTEKSRGNECRNERLLFKQVATRE